MVTWQKLPKVDVQSNKWYKTYKNAHFLSFRQFLGLAVGRWFIFFFAHRTHESVGKKKIFFCSEAEKTTTFFASISWETANKTYFFLGLKILCIFFQHAHMKLKSVMYTCTCLVLVLCLKNGQANSILNFSQFFTLFHSLWDWPYDNLFEHVNI